MPVEMPIDIPMLLTVERRGGRIEITPARSLPLSSWFGHWMAGAIVALAGHGVMAVITHLNLAHVPFAAILFAYITGLVVGLIGLCINVYTLHRNRGWADAGPLVTIDLDQTLIAVRTGRLAEARGSETVPFISLLGVYVRKWYHHEGEHDVTVRPLEDLSLELRDPGGATVMLPIMVNHRAGPSRKAAKALSRELGVQLHTSAAPRKDLLFRPKGLEEKA